MTKKRGPTTRRPSSGPPGPSDASGESSLSEYEKKRDFSVTPEPSPAPTIGPTSPPKGAPSQGGRSSHSGGPAVKKTAEAATTGPVFVVQKHDAKRLHYDVRLEFEGKLVSWAVPKGPTYDPKVKRLAVRVEDHPLDYAAFEGRIPDGNYGAGDVLVWDHGTFELPAKGLPMARMLEKGHVHVILHGDKLKGGWHLVRTKETNVWLFFKAEDAFANKNIDIAKDRPESIVTGHVATRGPTGTVTRVAPNKDAHELARVVGDVSRAVSSRLLGPPSEYLFEVKFDGYRIVASKAGADVRLTSRAGHDWTARFPEVARAVATLPVREAVFDGEVCVVDAIGRPSFEALQRHLSGERNVGHLIFAMFDLLWLDGRDLRSLPLEERRRLLDDVMGDAPSPLTFSRSIQGEMGDIVAAARGAGLEGLVAKRKGSIYTAGPTQAWIKIKFELRQDVAITGYTPMTGTKVVGALIVGLYDDEGNFVYAGKVGTGMSDKLRADLAHELDARRAHGNACPFARDPKIPDAIYTAPGRVIELGLREWTRDGSPRFPRFLGFRDDKTAAECLRESVDGFVDMSHAPRGTKKGRDARGPLAPGGARDAEDDAIPPPLSQRAGLVKLSNADKVLYPKDGITKRDIFAYYTDISPVMLPHLRGRPIHMQRWPDGIDKEEWFQHAAPPKAPPFVRQLPFDRDPDSAFEKGARQKWRIIPENVETLQYLANLAALTLHQRSSHLPPDATTDEVIAKALAMPNYVVIDLDPGDGPFSDLIRVAWAVRALLDALELESVVKTSGQRGLHIFVPLAPGHTHDDASAFAIEVARAVAKVLPDISTVETRKDKRKGRLYVDALQNGRGRTIVCPYSLRAKDGAPVSTPVEWNEVTDALDPGAFNLKTIRQRVDKRGDLLAPLLRGKGILPKVR